MEAGSIQICFPGDDYPSLQAVKGIAHYYNRELLRRANSGTIVHPLYPGDDLGLLYEDYSAASIGPPAMQFPWGSSGKNDLYGALLAYQPTMAWLRREVNGGRKIRFFSPSLAAEEFIRKAGLRWGQHVLNSTPEIAKQWDDKHSLRQLAAKGGLRYYFPPHTTASSLININAILQMNSGSELRVVKASNLASSEGMYFVPFGQILNSWDHGFPAIIEEAHPHIPFSVVFDVADRGPIFQYVSRQVLEGVPFGQPVSTEKLLQGNIGHRGNIVASLEQTIDGFGGVSFALEMERLLLPLMNLVHLSGYRGFICVDMMQTVDGRVFVLECNARTSNSMYAAEVLNAVEPKFKGTGVVVIMANIVVNTALVSYRLVRERLENLLYNGGNCAGLLLYHAPLLNLGLGKAGLIALGRDYQEALQIFREGERILKK